MAEGTLSSSRSRPPGGSIWSRSRAGGPLWSRDGKELFYVPAPGRLRVAAVKTAPIFTVTKEVDVPRGFGGATPIEPRTFDIMPDGRIVGRRQGRPEPRRIAGAASSFSRFKSC